MASLKAKPAKPRPDFPLFPHQSGQWAKKIRGRFYYFGRWSEPDTALGEYLRVRDYLLSGRTPPPSEDTRPTMRDIVNACLTHKKTRIESGELSRRSFADLYHVGGLLVDAFKDRPVEDLMPEDFGQFRAELSKGRSPVTLANLIRRSRVFLNFAFDACLIDRPVRTGKNFDVPSRKTLRQARIESGQKLFDAAELRLLIDNAREPVRSMILLACNAALGCTDLSELSLEHLDLPSGWLDFPRVKTAVERRCPLWPETVESLRNWLPRRPKAAERENGSLVYLTRTGQPFVRFDFDEATGKTLSKNNVSNEFDKLQRRLKIKRSRRSFYAIRHTWRTVADRCRDARAAAVVMGHELPGIESHYVEHVENDRLIAVSDTVRSWLFGNDGDSQAHDGFD